MASPRALFSFAGFYDSASRDLIPQSSTPPLLLHLTSSFFLRYLVFFSHLRTTIRFCRLTYFFWVTMFPVTLFPSLEYSPLPLFSLRENDIGALFQTSCLKHHPHLLSQLIYFLLLGPLNSPVSSFFFPSLTPFQLLTAAGFPALRYDSAALSSTPPGRSLA